MQIISCFFLKRLELFSLFYGKTTNMLYYCLSLHRELLYEFKVPASVGGGVDVFTSRTEERIRATIAIEEPTSAVVR